MDWENLKKQLCPRLDCQGKLISGIAAPLYFCEKCPFRISAQRMALLVGLGVPGILEPPEFIKEMRARKGGDKHVYNYE